MHIKITIFFYNTIYLVANTVIKTLQNTYTGENNEILSDTENYLARTGFL